MKTLQTLVDRSFLSWLRTGEAEDLSAKDRQKRQEREDAEKAALPDEQKKTRLIPLTVGEVPAGFVRCKHDNGGATLGEH